MENTEHTEGQGVNRRSFIKRAAATGGVVIFAAPAIQTVVAGAARASVGGGSAAPGPCGHSTGGADGTGCKGACTQAGDGLGMPCSDICNAACPVGQGNDNPCCSDSFCDPACYSSTAHGEVTYNCAPCPA